MERATEESRRLNVAGEAGALHNVSRLIFTLIQTIHMDRKKMVQPGAYSAGSDRRFSEPHSFSLEMIYKGQP